MIICRLQSNRIVLRDVIHFMEPVDNDSDMDTPHEGSLGGHPESREIAFAPSVAAFAPFAAASFSVVAA